MPDTATNPLSPQPVGCAEDWTLRRTVVALVGITTAFVALQIAHNLHLFSQPIYEEGDRATVSLLVIKAKQFELLHGHYSRIGFYHPGPALIYTLAGAEAVFYDALRLVPAPHNAHMLGHIILAAFLIGLSLTLIARGTKSGTAGAAAGLIFLVYFAREGHLANHWFAYVFFLLYMAFQVSAAAVASGRVGDLGWLALTSGLAVHGHVSFVAFVVPISTYAVARLWLARGYGLRGVPAADRRAWVVFAVVLGVFVLPIALHTALHYPGEIGRYLHYSKRPASSSPPAGAVGTFLCRTLTNDSPWGWRLALGVAAGALTAVATFRAPQRAFARQLGAVMVLSSAAMVYYAARGVDDLEQTYVGVFFGSVLLLGLTLIGMRVAAACDCGPVCRSAALAVGAGVAGWAMLTGAFTNGYRGAPEAPVLADMICSDPRWAGGPPAVTTDTRCWEPVAGVLVQMDRRGMRPWVVDRSWDVAFSDRFRLDGRPVTAMWQIDASPPGDTVTGSGRELGASSNAVFREVSTRRRLGESLPFASWCRAPGVKPVTGWTGMGRLTTLLPVSKRASVLVDLERDRPSEVRLMIRARGSAETANGGQRVGVEVNGLSVGVVEFPFDVICEREVVFPGVALGTAGPVRIEFTFPDAGLCRSHRHPGPAELYSIELYGLELKASKP